MKQTLKYLASVLTALLLVFSCIATTAAVLLHTEVLDPNTYTQIIKEQQLSHVISMRLLNYFGEQENTTGIPASVYAEAVSPENLEPVVDTTLTKLFNYVRGVSPDTENKPDFSVLESNMLDFFSQYAEENNIPKDDVYKDALRKNIEAAEKKITTECDVFKTASMEQAGLLAKARAIYPKSFWLLPVTIALTAVLVLILFLLHLRTWERWLYWLASSVLVSSILMLIPSLWLSATRWFDRFAVKSEQIFAAVTGFLYGMTHTVTVTAAGGIVLAVLLFVIAGIGGAARARREAVRSAKH